MLPVYRSGNSERLPKNSEIPRSHEERVKTEEKSVSQDPQTIIFGCTDPVWDARIKLHEAERQARDRANPPGKLA